METIKNFSQLIAHLSSLGERKRVVVVCPRDHSSQEAIRRAESEGFVEAIAVDDDDAAVAAQRAVEMVHRGEADILMKGLIKSDILLRAVLDRDHGLLQKGRVLTHTAVAQLPKYPKLIFYTDAAVMPYPTQEQRCQQILYLTTLCRSFGIAEPRISLIHCSEKADARHFPFTGGYADIIAESKEGKFGPCIIDGPLDLKTSFSPESLHTKHIDSPVGGEADGVVFPDIEGANIFHKTITLFADAEIAAILQGPDVPIVMPSRSDSSLSKYYSLALAALQSTANR